MIVFIYPESSSDIELMNLDQAAVSLEHHLNVISGKSIEDHAYRFDDVRMKLIEKNQKDIDQAHACMVDFLIETERKKEDVMFICAERPESDVLVHADVIGRFSMSYSGKEAVIHVCRKGFPVSTTLDPKLDY